MRKIFDYTSYRDLISDAVSDKGITLSSVASHLGLKSKSYMGLILRGEKSLQIDQIHSLKEILDLNAAEFDYFFHLVIFCDSTDKKTRAYHAEKMKTIRELQGGVAKTRRGSEEVLAQGHYPAVLLNLTLKRPWSDSKLASFFDVSLARLSGTYRDLESLGLIRQTETGGWEAQTIRLKVSKKSWSQAQKRFLKSQLANAHRIFDSSYEKSGKFYSQTITFSKESFEEVWDLIKDQMDRLADRSDRESAEELCQLNVQFYKVT